MTHLTPLQRADLELIMARHRWGMRLWLLPAPVADALGWLFTVRLAWRARAFRRPEPRRSRA